MIFFNFYYHQVSILIFFFPPSTMFLPSMAMTLAPPKYRCVSWDSFPPLYNPPPLKTTSSKTTQEYNAYIFMDYTSTLKTFGTPSQITLIFDINREFKLHFYSLITLLKIFKEKNHYKSYVSNISYVETTFRNNWSTYTSQIKYLSHT